MNRPLTPPPGPPDARIRMLALTRYSQLGASSRVRLMQFLPDLADAGVDVRVEPLVGDDYVADFYAGRRHPVRIAGRYGKRVALLGELPDIDLLWVEKEILPYLPWWAERMIWPRQLPVVTDHDDALFHSYGEHPSRLVRLAAGGKIDRIMAASRLVVAGNPYIAAHARAAGAPWVETLPSVVDTRVYQPRPTGSDQPPIIGWIGTPNTWAAYGAPMAPLLAEIAATHGARIMTVGARLEAGSDGPFDHQPWSQATEVALIQRMSVGIMPLADDPWSRGKCGYKLIQYMACAVPVVASPVGVNAGIVIDGENGFHARDAEGWRRGIGALIADPALAARLGAAGRARAEREFSLEPVARRLAGLLLRAARPGIPQPC